MNEADNAGRDGNEQDGNHPAEIASRVLAQDAEGSPVEGGAMVRRARGGLSRQDVHGSGFRKDRWPAGGGPSHGRLDAAITSGWC
jgi:hypothetical protein